MQKFCNGCKSYKDVKEFGLDSKSKDKLKSDCKNCRRATNKSYAKARRAIPKQRDLLNKRNREFKKKAVEKNPNYHRDNYQKNKINNRKNANKYYYNNIEKCLEASRLWKKNNRDKHIESSKEWKRNNKKRTKELQYISTTNYRARKRKATIQKFTPEELYLRMSIFNFVCTYCGGKFECIDHFMPLSLGGPHCLSNLRPCCKPCNNKKFNKHPKRWLEEINDE